MNQNIVTSFLLHLGSPRNWLNLFIDYDFSLLTFQQKLDQNNKSNSEKRIIFLNNFWRPYLYLNKTLLQVSNLQVTSFEHCPTSTGEENDRLDVKTGSYNWFAYCDLQLLYYVNVLKCIAADLTRVWCRKLVTQ